MIRWQNGKITGAGNAATARYTGVKAQTGTEGFTRVKSTGSVRFVNLSRKVNLRLKLYWAGWLWMTDDPKAKAFAYRQRAEEIRNVADVVKGAEANIRV